MLDKKIKVEGHRTRKYSVSTLLVGCLYGMLLGYSRPYHMKILRADKVFQKIVGLCSFPAQSTISRFLSSLKISMANQISASNFDFIPKMRKQYKPAWRAGRGYREITLDLPAWLADRDSHVIPVYGNHQRAAPG